MFDKLLMDTDHLHVGLRFTSLFSHTPPQLGRCLMSMSNTMICGATKIWYYVPEKSSGAFEAWLNATRPGYIENLEAGNKVALTVRSAVDV